MVKSSTVRDISRGSFYLGLEQITATIGGFLYAMIVLRMLGPATYGVLNIGQAVVGLAGVLTTNIEAYLERFVAEIDARGLGGTLNLLIRKVLAVKGLLALLAAVLVILLADWIATSYGQRDLRRLLPALAPLIFLEGATLVMRYTLFGLQRFRLIWLVALGNNLLKLAVVFTLWKLGEGVVALVAGIVAVQGVTIVALGILVLRALPKESGEASDVPTYRKIWSYVLPLFGARIFFLSGQHLNRLILGALLPAHQLGLVSFALMTIERFIGLAAAVANSFLPALSRLRGEGREASIEQVVNEGYRMVTALAVILMAAVFTLAREAVLITGGHDYVEAILPLQILALVPLFRTIQQPLTMSFYTFEKTRVVFWLAGLKFIVEPIAYPFLIPHFGISGVALASLLSSVVVLGPALRVAGRLFPDTKAQRRKGVMLAWFIGALIFVAGMAINPIASSWSGLPIRVALLLTGVLAVLLFRIVSGNDLRRLGDAMHRPWADRILQRLAILIDRLQGV